VADSLLDVGTESQFPFDIDWSALPSHQFNITRYLFENPGTSSYIEEKNPETPISFEIKVYIEDKDMEYDFLDFIHTHIGRAKRFWVKYPMPFFQLTESLSSGSTGVKCEPNNFELFFVGHERIFIEMNNGDIITRHVTSATYDSTNDEVNLVLATAVDRDIAIGDVFMLGRYLLVRFDSDDFDLNLETNTKSEVSLKFMELIRDYDDLAANP